MIKRKKRTPHKILTDRLDEVVSLIVRKRDGRCVQWEDGNCAGPLQCGHLITRSKQSVRWDLINCNAQCAGHNMAHEYNPHPYTLWWIRKYGLDAYKDLVRRSNVIVKRYDRDLKDQIIYLERTYGFSEKEEESQEEAVQQRK